MIFFCMIIRHVWNLITYHYVELLVIVIWKIFFETFYKTQENADINNWSNNLRKILDKDKYQLNY